MFTRKRSIGLGTRWNTSCMDGNRSCCSLQHPPPTLCVMCSDWGMGVGPERADRITGEDENQGKGNRGEQPPRQVYVSAKRVPVSATSIYLNDQQQGRNLLVLPCCGESFFNRRLSSTSCRGFLPHLSDVAFLDRFSGVCCFKC